MSQRRYILAHDLGTTGNKATLFDAETGAAAASLFEPYETVYPQPGWAEQNAQDWRRAVYRGTQRLLEQVCIPPGEVAVVSFSGTMNGALPVDAAGRPLRPAILWADQRAVVEAQLLADAYGAERVYRCTGSRPGAAYTAAKLLWIKRHQPEIYARTRQVLQSKDYAAFLFCGVFATDFSDASNTNLFDLERRNWASDLIRAAGLDEEKLPPIHASTAVIGRVTQQAARETGLLAGTPVVIGGGDGACATVGAGSVLPGDAYTYAGSSAWIAVTADRPVYDPQMRTFTLAHLDPSLYMPLGSMQCAGGSFDWLEGLLRGEDDARLYESLDAAAAAAPPGAHGLLFLPHLMGERSPYWNPGARGAFVGLSMAHGRPDVTRAVMEGVAFNLRSILDALGPASEGTTAMRLIGGAARSRTWRQILADILGLPIALPDLPAQATSLGAAIAGGVGVGLYAGFAVARQFARADEAEQPDPTARRCYAGLYPLYLETYRALEPIFGRLTSAANQEDSSLTHEGTPSRGTLAR
jgi:xylulokinase